MLESPIITVPILPLLIITYKEIKIFVMKFNFKRFDQSIYFTVVVKI